MPSPPPTTHDPQKYDIHKAWRCVQRELNAVTNQQDTPQPTPTLEALHAVTMIKASEHDGQPEPQHIVEVGNALRDLQECLTNTLAELFPIHQQNHAHRTLNAEDLEEAHLWKRTLTHIRTILTLLNTDTAIS